MSRAAEADTPASSSPRFLLYRWPWLAGAAAAGLAVVVWLALPPSAVRAPESDRFAQVTSGADTEKPPVEPEQSAAHRVPVAADQAQAKAPSTPARPADPAAPAPQPRDRQAFDEVKRRADADRKEERKLDEEGERRAPVQKMPVAAPEALPPVAPPPARVAAESATAQAPPAAAQKPDASARDTASPAAQVTGPAKPGVP